MQGSSKELIPTTGKQPDTNWEQRLQHDYPEAHQLLTEFQSCFEDKLPLMTFELAYQHEQKASKDKVFNRALYFYNACLRFFDGEKRQSVFDDLCRKGSITVKELREALLLNNDFYTAHVGKFLEYTSRYFLFQSYLTHQWENLNTYDNTQPNNRDHTADFPDEVLFRIFSGLNTYKDLLNVSSTSKRWYSIAHDTYFNPVFKEAARKTMPELRYQKLSSKETGGIGKTQVKINWPKKSQRTAVLNTLLIDAVKRNLFPLAELCLKEGANIKTRNAKGETIAHIVARKTENQADTAVKFRNLCSTFSSIQDVCDKKGLTPFLAALEAGNEDFVSTFTTDTLRMLTEYRSVITDKMIETFIGMLKVSDGINFKKNGREALPIHNTALNTLAEYGHTSLIQFLIKNNILKDITPLELLSTATAHKQFGTALILFPHANKDLNAIEALKRIRFENLELLQLYLAGVTDPGVITDMPRPTCYSAIQACAHTSKVRPLKLMLNRLRELDQEPFPFPDQFLSAERLSRWLQEADNIFLWKSNNESEQSSSQTESSKKVSEKSSYVLISWIQNILLSPTVKNTQRAASLKFVLVDKLQLKRLNSGRQGSQELCRALWRLHLINIVKNALVCYAYLKGNNKFNLSKKFTHKSGEGKKLLKKVLKAESFEKCIYEIISYLTKKLPQEWEQRFRRQLLHSLMRELEIPERSTESTRFQQRHRCDCCRNHSELHRIRDWADQQFQTLSSSGQSFREYEQTEPKESKGGSKQLFSKGH